MIRKSMYFYIVFSELEDCLSEYSRHLLLPIGKQLRYERNEDVIDQWVLENWVNNEIINVFGVRKLNTWG